MQPESLSPAHDGSGVNEPDHVPTIERLGNELAARTQELERQKQIVADLLRHVGEPCICRGPNCKQGLVMVMHRNGVLTPYNLDGTNHFITCVDRELFHRRRKRA